MLRASALGDAFRATLPDDGTGSGGRAGLLLGWELRDGDGHRHKKHSPL